VWRARCVLTRLRACAAGEHTLPECVINPTDKMVRRKWRKYVLIVISTDERLAATAPSGAAWDTPAELAAMEQDMGGAY
jgi:hypothetical protein